MHGRSPWRASSVMLIPTGVAVSRLESLLQGAMVRGSHCLHHWSRTQTTVALSSGEAELNSALKGGTELIGAHTLMTELNISAHPELLGDSSACFGTLSSRRDRQSEAPGNKAVVAPSENQGRSIDIHQNPQRDQCC